jgi:flagellar biosynthesis protein FliQ
VTATELSVGAWIAFIQLCGPVIALMLLIGLAIGVLQTATQLRDSSIPFIVKLGGLAVLTTIAGRFMIQGVERYAVEVMNGIPGIIHG